MHGYRLFLDNLYSAAETETSVSVTFSPLHLLSFFSGLSTDVDIGIISEADNMLMSHLACCLEVLRFWWTATLQGCNVHFTVIWWFWHFYHPHSTAGCFSYPRAQRIIDASKLRGSYIIPFTISYEKDILEDLRLIHGTEWKLVSTSDEWRRCYYLFLFYWWLLLLFLHWFCNYPPTEDKTRSNWQTTLRVKIYLKHPNTVSQS